MKAENAVQLMCNDEVSIEHVSLCVFLSCGVQLPRGTLKSLSRCLISMVMERWTWRSLNR